MTTFNDISVDCETLGTAYDAPVIAIGARAFDRSTGKLYNTFYKEVMLSSAIKSGRVDGGTVSWWITQSPRAKAIFGDAKYEAAKLSLASVLVEFSQWCRGEGKGSNDRSGPLFVWANGPSQDITWLEHAYTVGGHGLTIPWRHDHARCLRTVVEPATLFAGFDKSKVKNVGVAHNAVDDATYQANVISAAWKALAGKAVKPPVEDDDEL